MAKIILFIEQYPFILAFLLGLIPAILWLWFWLKEDHNPESHKMITLSFLGGILAVILVLPLERMVLTYLPETNIWSFIIWASLEEIFKFGIVYYIALKRKVNDEPVDNIIYLIISALGFVAMENTLFLIDPIRAGDFVSTIVTSNLRFIGASLLHVIASATIGIFMALSFYKSKISKRIYLSIGIVLAIVLHIAFNLFIIQETSGNIFFVLGVVWLGIIVLLLLFEKVKRIIPN